MDVSVDDILAIGFTGSMYGLDQKELESMVDEVIFEQENLVQARVGPARYALLDNQTAVNKTIKNLAAAEMARRRIVALSANTVFDAGESAEAAQLRLLIFDWENQAHFWIGRVFEGIVSDTGDFSSGVNISESENRLFHPRLVTMW